MGWEGQNGMCDVRYGYAITAHKSQGSTYDISMVDLGSMASKGLFSRGDRNKMAYVGVSRAADKAIVLINNKNETKSSSYSENYDYDDVRDNIDYDNDGVIETPLNWQNINENQLQPINKTFHDFILNILKKNRLAKNVFTFNGKMPMSDPKIKEIFGPTLQELFAPVSEDTINLFDYMMKKYDLTNYISNLKNTTLNLFRDAVNKKFTGKDKVIAKISEDGKKLLEQISGLKFKNYVDIRLNPSELVHIYNDHYGNNEKDKGNNNPLTDEDIKNMVEVINFPDDVIFLGRDTKTQENKFAFVKSNSNGTYNLIDIVVKNGSLVPKTYFNTKKGISQRIMELQQGSSLFSTPEANSANSLSKVGAKVQNFIETPKIRDKNYAHLQSKIKLMATRNGEMYGFVYNGNVYIDENLLNSNTPIHEFGHLWNHFIKANYKEL
jgi:hypothetical protein